MADDLERYLHDVAQVPWASYSHAYGAAEDVEGQLQALVSLDAEQRERALHDAFGNLWHQGTVYEATAPAVPFLLRALELPHVAERETLLVLLASMAQGTSYHDVHACMVEDSRRESADYTAQVAVELSWVEAARLAVAEGLPTFARLLEAPAAPVRAAAAYALACCPEEAGAHLAALEAAFDAEREPPAQLSLGLALARVGHEAGATAAVAERLRGALAGDVSGRLAAAAGLASLGAGDPDVLAGLEGGAALGEVLATSCWNEAGDGLVFLTQLLGEQQDAQVELVLRLLRAEDPQVQGAALFAAEELGYALSGAGARFMPAFVELLAGPDPELRRRAVDAIAGAGAAARDAADGLLALLGGDADAHTQARAAATLCRLRDPRALPWLVARLDAASALPSELGAAVEHLGPWAPALLDPLTRLLEREPQPGNGAIKLALALGRYGPAAAPAVPLLVSWLGRGLEHAVPLALADLGPAAREALEALRPLLVSDDAHVRVNAAQAVWAISADAAAVKEALRPLLADGHAASRALEALEPLGDEAREFEPRARELLAEEDLYGWTTVRAARLLARLGAPAADLLPVLRAHVENVPVGVLAVECLRDLGPAASPALPQLRAQLDGAPGGGVVDEIVETHEAWLALCREAIAAIEA